MRLTDLSTAQIRMLARLAGQVSAEDATGLEVAEMKGQDWRVAESLVALGLAEKRAGWNMTGWVTLTDRGRKVRETGEA